MDNFNTNQISTDVENLIQNSEEIKIIVVYHTYLVNQWRIQVEEQLKRLYDSGLYDAADKICVTSDLGETTREEAIEFFSAFPKLEIELSDQNYGEYLAIRKVRELSFLHKNAKILNFHTKGIFNNWITFNGKEKSERKIRNSKAWRYCMEYFTIDRWRECVELLETWDNVGVTCNAGWYWGNFWWSSFKHISKTVEPHHSTRWTNEAWLNCEIPDSKNFEFWHFEIDPFQSELRPEFYMGGFEKYKQDRLIVKSALWGSCPFEIDEGYSGYKFGITEDVTEKVQASIDQNGGTKIDFTVGFNFFNTDPIFGYRKCLDVELYPETNPNLIIRLGQREGHLFKFSF